MLLLIFGDLLLWPCHGFRMQQAYSCLLLTVSCLVAGFNRTGFVVCSYLVQALGMSVNEALAAFEEARPPGVKHERFVQELHRRFDNHRWGSGHSTVGSETAGSVGGFSQSRTSYEGSVGSVQSDFKGVAEHLQQKQQVPSRQAKGTAFPTLSTLFLHGTCMLISKHVILWVGWMLCNTIRCICSSGRHHGTVTSRVALHLAAQGQFGICSFCCTCCMRLLIEMYNKPAIMHAFTYWIWCSFVLFCLMCLIVPLFSQTTAG